MKYKVISLQIVLNSEYSSLYIWPEKHNHKRKITIWQWARKINVDNIEINLKKEKAFLKETIYPYFQA